MIKRILHSWQPVFGVGLSVKSANEIKVLENRNGLTGVHTDNELRSGKPSEVVLR
jgi:hypothetical protein